MKDIIVLAMHGSPPLDFPREEMAEFFSLETRLGHGRHEVSPVLRRRFEELEAKMRFWPRTDRNDPFYAGSKELAEELARETGLKVLLGFNEFCGPSLDEVFYQAASEGAERVIVVTPMMTRGGEHAEKDIPAAVGRAREKHPGVAFLYAWPYHIGDVARFLSGHIRRWV